MSSCRIGSRQELLAALTAATAPGASERLLAIVKLHGLGATISHGGEPVTDTVLDEAEHALIAAVGNDGRCYRPRFDEWCILFDLDIETSIRTLDQATAAIDECVARRGIAAEAGVAVLPDEATDPIDALARADRRVAPTRPGLVRERRLTHQRRRRDDHAGNVVALFPGAVTVLHR